MIKKICNWLWVRDIPLGQLAPDVLGGVIGRWPHRRKRMSTGSSGGKPLCTRRHTDEDKSMEKSPEVSHEGESRKDHEGLGNTQPTVSC